MPQLFSSTEKEGAIDFEEFVRLMVWVAITASDDDCKFLPKELATFRATWVSHVVNRPRREVGP